MAELSRAVERLIDLIAIRDRYANKPVPVTGQIHSLSYPRLHQELARLLLVPVVFFACAVALPFPLMLLFAFVTGFVWDALAQHQREENR